MASTPRERRQERTRQAILNVALKIITEKGAANLSLREIARRIDYSPAGIYEYFGSKDEIIDAVCETSNERLASLLNAVSIDLPLEEYLVELGMAYIQYAHRYPEHFLLTSSRLTPPAEQPRDLTPEEMVMDANFKLLFRAIQQGIDSGIFQPQANYTTLEISYSLWALVHGMATLQITQLRDVRLPIDQEATDREAIKIFIKGLKCT